jgi:hypothetical protein
MSIFYLVNAYGCDFTSMSIENFVSQLGWLSHSNCVEYFKGIKGP